MTKNAQKCRRHRVWMVVLPIAILLFWSQSLQIARNRERQRFAPLFQKTNNLCEILLPSPVPLYFTGTRDKEWYVEGLQQTGRKICHADFETQTGRITVFAFFNPNPRLTAHPAISLTQARSRANYWYKVLSSALEQPGKPTTSVTSVEYVAPKKIIFYFHEENCDFHIKINWYGGELDTLYFVRRPSIANSSTRTLNTAFSML